MLILLAVIIIILVIALLVLLYYPPLGSLPTKKRKQQLARSDHYDKGKFVNLIPTKMDFSLGQTLKMLVQFIRGNKESKPSKPFLTERLSEDYLKSEKQPKLTWFGHSAALLQLDGQTLLLDPMFGTAPSPFPQIGGKRFSKVLPFEIEQLPSIDAVLISHDHYDHLDYGSILKLNKKVKRFIVPLGVAPHLIRWGIEEDRIEEHDWWDEFQYGGLNLACTPARHFSGRGLTDRDATLWCSWVIQGSHTKVFFSGDSGYGPHFEEIGNKYGPFDLTLMECGQYDERWSVIHMMPEETVQAHLDVKGKVMIPIHWGAFALALHSWIDPIERVLKAAEQHQAVLATPKIGETVFIDGTVYPSSRWWR